jgi:fructosamine-3-kinase
MPIWPLSQAAIARNECINTSRHRREDAAEQRMSDSFVKQNRSRYPDQLLCEARGLDALRRAATGTGIDVPQIIDVDQRTLTMGFIRSTGCSPEQWTKLGQGLASIHARPQARFGFDEDNYIGLNPQPNAFTDSWGGFFLQQRLEFQIGLIADPRRRGQFARYLQQKAVRLREFLDSEALSPSLLHGDLWNGNVLCGADGRVWLIDPATYNGDPDVDLAMTEMFGGFPAQFYAAYRARRPEPASYPLKKRIYNLYHYLNHLNLFGEAYLDGCESGLATLAQI